MSHREFLDEDGRSWEVWDVRPSSHESPTTTNEGASELADLEPNARQLFRLNLSTELCDGWLAFRCRDESRRLAPIPQRWVTMDDQDLALLVRAAKPIVRATPRS